MANDGDDYKVGYGKPPRHSQFVPGTSGNKGRRRKRETQGQIIARLRDEKVEINGQMVTKFELAVTQTLNQTIRSGKPRDLTLLLELLDKHGAMPKVDERAEAERQAASAMKKIHDFFNRSLEIDPEDIALLDRYSREEAKLLMACSRCAPELKSRWARKEQKELAKRYGKTQLQHQIERAQSGINSS
jgi:Family of unknown function (DUF5681)